MTSIASEPQPTTAPSTSLTALERCDRCGAQAYTRFENPIIDAEFLFCAHHTRENEGALNRQGFMLTHDERHLLAPTNRQQGDSY